MPTTTKSGAYQIFDITNFLPGRPIPKEFCEEAEKGGFWFFMPSEWTEVDGWRSTIGYLRNFPMIYSTGFPTEKAALEAAEKWEAGAAERARFEAGWQTTIKTVEL